MSDSSTTINPGTGGDLIDMELISTVKRQRNQIGGSALAEVARVVNGVPALTDYGLVVRSPALKLEDVGHASGDAGFAVWGVRNEALATFSGTELDYTPQAHDRAGAAYVRPIQRATYIAVYRLADTTATLDLSISLTTGNKQVATIYHTGSSTKLVTILQAGIMLANNSAIAGVEFELRRLSASTAPATGNPSITPLPYDPAEAAAEATCLALPGTAGSVANANQPASKHFTYVLAAAANPTNMLGLDGTELVLYDLGSRHGQKPLTMRAGTAEGYAINGHASATTTVRGSPYVVFTEE